MIKKAKKLIKRIARKPARKIAKTSKKAIRVVKKAVVKKTPAKGDLRSRLRIPADRLAAINNFLLDPHNEIVGAVIRLVEKYGGPEAINKKAAEARKLGSLLSRLRATGSPYFKDLEWLAAERDRGAFISVADWRKKILGEAAAGKRFNKKTAVTLEVSALQYFPWIIAEAKEAIERRDLMPGRYIRVRTMKEQVADQGDTLAVAAAMQIIGASYVETLDTKGTDGSNVHLGGPATITGYFGGVGQPNDYALKYADEALHYLTEYGIRQVLNVNPGTVLIGYLLNRLGVDNEFKISVFMGNDNPYAVLWTLLGAKLFARQDGTTPLVGFNLSNSVNNDTIRKSSWIRHELGFENQVRIEHHITETWKSIVRQPYDRLQELIEVAAEVPNISAKHEGGIPDVEKDLPHPSDILDYFAPKQDVEAQGLMPAFERNYIEKHRSVVRTAEALTRAGIDVICAWNLHK